jgi:hypothetical protein
VNPAGSSVNPNLKEQDKSGLLYNVKGGLSWYISSVFALDVLGGWSSVDVVGKTANGAVWLDSSMLSPYDYFQYFRNTNDQDVIKFLKLFTDF